MKVKLFSDRIRATSFNVIVESEELVEVSFSRPWDPSLKGKFVPLNIDKRFVGFFPFLFSPIISKVPNHFLNTNWHLLLGSFCFVVALVSTLTPSMNTWVHKNRKRSVLVKQGLPSSLGKTSKQSLFNLV